MPACLFYSQWVAGRTTTGAAWSDWNEWDGMDTRLRSKGSNQQEEAQVEEAQATSCRLEARLQVCRGEESKVTDELAMLT